MSEPRVVFYTRAGCHLCEDARRVLDRVCADLGETYREVDVDDAAETADLEPALRDRFSEEVPVTYVDGTQHDFWRLDETRLRAALASAPR